MARKEKNHQSAPSSEKASHIYKSEDSHYFACRLTEFISPAALGVQLQTYLEDNRRRQLDLLNCLMNPRDERFTYDLRIISQPDHSRHSPGFINVVLLCRMTGFSPEETERHAQQIIHFLEASFEDYTFDLVPAAEMPRLLKPFDYLHVTEITRRCELSRLDTLQTKTRRGRMGFTSPEEPPPAAESHGNAIVHLYPYLMTSDWFDRLFMLLLLLSLYQAFKQGTGGLNRHLRNYREKGL